jgi:hypothetical protein
MRKISRYCVVFLTAATLSETFNIFAVCFLQTKLQQLPPIHYLRSHSFTKPAWTKCGRIAQIASKCPHRTAFVCSPHRRAAADALAQANTKMSLQHLKRGTTILSTSSPALFPSSPSSAQSAHLPTELSLLPGNYSLRSEPAPSSASGHQFLFPISFVTGSARRCVDALTRSCDAADALTAALRDSRCLVCLKQPPRELGQAPEWASFEQQVLLWQSLVWAQERVAVAASAAGWLMSRCAPPPRRPATAAHFRAVGQCAVATA